MTSKYTDYLVYTTNESRFNALNKNNVISAQRDGHYILLIRSKSAPTLASDAEILATGHCTEDCPFSKLSADALAKYQNAYSTEPYTQIEINKEGEEVEVTITPPFRFGVFL